jgi:hypothetical protein
LRCLAGVLPLGAFSTSVGFAVDTLQVVRGVIESLTSTPTAVVIGVDDAHLLAVLPRVVLTVGDGEPIPPGLQDIWE